MMVMTNGSRLLPMGNGLECGWSVRFSRTPGGELEETGAAEMMEFSFQEEAGRRSAEWRSSALFGADFTVRAEFVGDGELLEGSFEFCGNSSGFMIEEICFPQISLPLGESSRLLYPHNQGILRTRGTLREHERWALEGMQCTALLSENDGVYFDFRDTRRRGKAVEYRIDADRITICGICLLPITPENREHFRIPYTSGVAQFRGGWFEAAQLYGDWARRQSWFVNRRQSDRMREIGIWVWNRGRAAAVIPPVELLGRKTGVPVALDWYWWHHNPYDTGYPDFWPPREGVAAFGEAVKSLNERGIFTQVYTNGMTWDIDGDTYGPEGGRSCIVVERDGTERKFMFNVYTKHSLGFMCGEAPAFQDKMCRLVGELANSGLPGVYLDMIGGCIAGACYNPAHRHAPGGGSYNYDGFRAMLTRIRKENPGIALSTEYCTEMLDLFDSMIVLEPSQERQGYEMESEYVPFFSAVYHGGVTMFGNYALPDFIPPWDPLWPDSDRWQREEDWAARFPEQFFIEMARTLVWGMQPCVCNLREEHLTGGRFAREAAFLIEIARFYHAHREFLYDGAMRSPGKLCCATLEVDFLARGIFTTEATAKQTRKSCPSVLHSVWQAPDGRRALICVNYTREARDFEFESADGRSAGRLAPGSCGCFILS